MGLFNFFSKKPAEQKTQSEPKKPPIDDNTRLIEILKGKLIDMGYQVERHPQYLTLIVNAELEISTAIIDIPGAHPFLMQLNVLTVHPVYFPQGIYENLVGAGETIDKKINTALDNYLNSTFSPIMDGFSDTRDPEVDLLVKTSDKDILWHPKLSDLMLQGQWEEPPEWTNLFEILKHRIATQLTGDKFNWLKIYIYRKGLMEQL